MPRKYSPKTLARLTAFLENTFSGGDLDALFFSASIPDSHTSGANKPSKIVNALRYLTLTHPITGDMEHSDLLDLLFDEVVIRKKRQFEDSPYGYQTDNTTTDSFKQALNADGYDIQDGHIIPLDSIEVAAEISILAQRLGQLEMSDVQSTLDQAHQNFIEENYEACNAMLRSSFEATLKYIAVTLAGSEVNIPKSRQYLGPVDIRNYLENQNFFTSDEKNLVDKFYGYASTKGSHPGISNESESRLRRLMTISLIQYCLEKFESHTTH